MSSQSQSRYSSLVFYLPEDIKQTFIDECAEVGLQARRVQCFSATPSVREYLGILYERGQKYAPQVLKVLSMLQRKTSIRIEVAADRKIIELRGLSPDDAIKLIQAADAIRVTDTESVGISDAGSTPASSTK